MKNWCAISMENCKFVPAFGWQMIGLGRERRRGKVQLFVFADAKGSTVGFLGRVECDERIIIGKTIFFHAGKQFSDTILYKHFFFCTNLKYFPYCLYHWRNEPPHCNAITTILTVCINREQDYNILY